MAVSFSYSEYFNELNLHELVRYAERWAREYPIIDRILLYNYSSPYRAELEEQLRGKITTIYAIVFEINDIIQTLDFELNVNDEEYLKLLSITEYYETIRSDNSFNRLLDNRFFCVYKKEPENNFRLQWIFIPKRPFENLPSGVRVNERYVLLYPREESEISEEDKEAPLKKPEARYGIPEDCFIREGDFWTISFHGEKIYIRDTHQIRYIANLLNQPSSSIRVDDLHKLVSGVDPNGKSKEFEVTEEQLAEQGMSLSDLSETLSHDELEKHKQNIRKILNKIEISSDMSSDDTRIVAEGDLDKYRRYLLDEYGIKSIISECDIKFIKLKRSGSESEKIRKNVCNQIKKGIKKISTHLDSLSKYLDIHLKLGISCSYNPDPQNPIKWKIIL